MAKKDTILTYTEERLKALGITPEYNAASIVVNDTSQFPHTTTTKAAQWFTEYNPNESDKMPNDMLTGAMQFLYLNLDGTQQTYRTTDNRHEKKYYIHRLHPTQATKDRKYFQPAKSGSHLFHTPGIIHAYTNQLKVNRLYLIEGQLKAFAAWQAGYIPATTKKGKGKGGVVPVPEQHTIQIMGMMGITQSGDADYTKEVKSRSAIDSIVTGKRFHDDIMEYIRVCRPDEIVIIYDADCKQMASWHKENEPNKDLGKRFLDFFNALRNIREYGKGVVKDVYFTHIKEEYLLQKIKPGADDVVKGLDDLLIHTNPDKVIEDLQQLTQSRTYFECINLTTESNANIRKAFLLTKSKGGVPDMFYRKFEAYINSTPFKWCGSIYISEGGDLKMQKHADSEQFKRIGCNYMKVVYIPNSKGVFERKYEPWKKTEITSDYVNGLGIKNFLDTIEKYDAPCNVPEHDPEKYQQDIIGPHGGKTFNLYYKVDHDIEKGEWAATERYLKHVFQDKYDVALDWLTILYRYPNQKLPVVCLVSKDKNTGKSTFLWYLRELFKENVTVIGNAEIHDNFNDDYASKLVIGIDEAIFDKQVVIERIKSWVTSNRIKMNTKFMSRQEISFIGKFVITSNNEDSFIRIDDDEARFWVNKVPTFPDKDRDPHLLDKLMGEIPAFLHYLKSEHTIKYANVDRLWFGKEVTNTEALEKLKTQSVSWGVSSIRHYVREQFKAHQQIDLYFTCDDLFQNCDRKGNNVNAQYFQKCLTKEMNLESTCWRAPKFEVIEETERFYVISQRSKPLNFYHFKVEDCLQPAEYSLWINPDELKEVREEKRSFNNTRRELIYFIPDADKKPADDNTNANDLPF
ncbi:MAG: primase-helicase family protein [Bacteroidota bacterium]